MNPNELPDSLAAELFGKPAANALPIRWIQALFTRLEIRYGDAWTRKWAAIPDLALVHDDWSRQLAGVSGDAIAHALKHLPERDPPTAGQFLALCRRYVPESDVAMLGWKPQPLPPKLAEKVTDFRDGLRRKAMRAGMVPSKNEGDAA